MIRDLLVPLPGTSGDDIALAAGLDLARSCDAHLVAVLPAPLLTTHQVPWAISSPELIAEVSTEYEHATQKRAAELRERLSRVARLVGPENVPAAAFTEEHRQKVLNL